MATDSLFAAIRNGDVNDVERRIGEGADAHATSTTDYSTTSMHMTLDIAYYDTARAMIHVLVGARVSIDAEYNEQTALDFALGDGLAKWNTASIQALVDMGANSRGWEAEDLLKKGVGLLGLIS